LIPDLFEFFIFDRKSQATEESYGEVVAMTPVFWGTPPSLPPKPKKLRRFIKKAMTGKKRPDGFFPLSLPNLPYPTQSYGGQVVLAKELSMIVRF